MDLFELSQLLSKDDVVHLLKKLYTQIDNKTQISEITGLTRRTLDSYLHEKVTDIKQNIKFRVLGASYNYNREYTLQFLLSILKLAIAYIAYSSLDFYFDRLLKISEFGEFQDLYAKFHSILQENKYYLNQNYPEEIIRLTNNLATKKAELLIQDSFIKITSESENSMDALWKESRFYDEKTNRYLTSAY